MYDADRDGRTGLGGRASADGLVAGCGSGWAGLGPSSTGPPDPLAEQLAGQLVEEQFDVLIGPSGPPPPAQAPTPVQRTVLGWSVTRARLRTRREPELEAVARDPERRLLDVDREVWPDPAVDPNTVPAVVAAVLAAEACREARERHGPQHFSDACHRVRPVLRVLPGGARAERRADAG